MPRLEDELSARFPRLFRGRKRFVTRPLLRAVARVSKLEAIEAFLDANSTLRGLAFIRAGLDHLCVRHCIAGADLNRIPRQGGVVVVANHPSGALDAFALLDAIGRVRPDVRIVANDVLMAIEPISELLLPVRILGGRPGSDSIRAIEHALEDGACVVIFPAGEVSRASARGIRDGRWRPGFLRFARAAGVPVLPIHVSARNSLLFYGASAVFKPAATALLAREMFNRRDTRITLRVGEPISITGEQAAEETIRNVRAALYALPRRGVQDAGSPTQEVLIAPMDPALVARDVQTLELLGQTSDGREIRVGALQMGAPLLQEIGRLREYTFRAVGEGTGKRLDLDIYDTWYDHIVLWDAPARRIVGAYRVARGARVLAERGLAGLYTSSLFEYTDDAVSRIAEGMELGRSFVAPEYWNSRSLDYLWQGVGAYIARHPKVRYLFGPVSISAALPSAARDQLVAYYTRYFGGDDALARSRQPFRYFGAPPDFQALDGETAFKVLRQNLDALGAQVPVLYKQYTELCEPGGARFLAFGVDPEFSNAVDGLIEVDVQSMQPKKRQRYLRQAPATGAA